MIEPGKFTRSQTVLLMKACPTHFNRRFLSHDS